MGFSLGAALIIWGLDYIATGIQSWWKTRDERYAAKQLKREIARRKAEREKDRIERIRAIDIF